LGIARLLTKGWVLFCVYAGLHALYAARTAIGPHTAAIAICTLWFAAMGVLFAAGYGVSGYRSFRLRLKLHHLLPGFDGVVFLLFVLLSFLAQIFLAPVSGASDAAQGLSAAVYFILPGQRTLTGALQACGLDGGRTFASAFAWMLAAIFLASAASRLKLTAGLIRLEHDHRPDALGPTLRAFLLGIAAVVGIQFLVVGSAYPWVPCSGFAHITGQVLLGLAPLMLSYLIVAAMASLVASAPANNQ
jgi:hypothetical protein